MHFLSFSFLFSHPPPNIFIKDYINGYRFNIRDIIIYGILFIQIHCLSIIISAQLVKERKIKKNNVCLITKAGSRLVRCLNVDRSLLVSAIKFIQIQTDVNIDSLTKPRHTLTRITNIVNSVYLYTASVPLSHPLPPPHPPSPRRRDASPLHFTTYL